jgi:hypothetical protein
MVKKQRERRKKPWRETILDWWMLIWSISNRDWEVQWFSDSSATASRSAYSDCVANSRIWNSTTIMKLDDGWMHPSVTKEEKNWRIDLTYLPGCRRMRLRLLSEEGIGNRILFFSFFYLVFIFKSSSFCLCSLSLKPECTALSIV